MKIKGRVQKLVNFNAMNVPCSSVEFSQLRDGKEINLKDEKRLPRRNIIKTGG